jgi:superfamily I DNA and/or RNA helicase
MNRTLDYLVIDEAGQVSLADALAMGTSARNVILLGDPLQLAQVSQGGHPEGSGVSVLEHLLGNAPSVPEERGGSWSATTRTY